MTGTCRHGHPRAEQGYRSPAGKLRCRTCDQASQKARAVRAREQFRAEHAGHELRPHGQPTVGLICLTCRYTVAVDEAAVQRAIEGRPPAYMSAGDRRAAIVRLASRGASQLQIARTVAVSARTVERHLAAARRAA